MIVDCINNDTIINIDNDGVINMNIDKDINTDLSTLILNIDTYVFININSTEHEKRKTENKMRNCELKNKSKLI